MKKHRNLNMFWRQKKGKTKGKNSSWEMFYVEPYRGRGVPARVSLLFYSYWHPAA